jgi:hypothetical protein
VSDGRISALVGAMRADQHAALLALCDAWESPDDAEDDPRRLYGQRAAAFALRTWLASPLNAPEPRCMTCGGSRTLPAPLVPILAAGRTGEIPCPNPDCHHGAPR